MVPNSAHAPRGLEPCHIPTGTMSCGLVPAARSGKDRLLDSPARVQQQSQRRSGVPVVGLRRTVLPRLNYSIQKIRQMLRGLFRVVVDTRQKHPGDDQG